MFFNIKHHIKPQLFWARLEQILGFYGEQPPIHRWQLPLIQQVSPAGWLVFNETFTEQQISPLKYLLGRNYQPLSSIAQSSLICSVIFLTEIIPAIMSSPTLQCFAQDSHGATWSCSIRPVIKCKGLHLSPITLFFNFR